MKEDIIIQLSSISNEEKRILEGQHEIDSSLYAMDKNFVIDSHKLLQRGELIQIRPHTRFIHFPKHTHNYVEVVYMCKGTTTHFIDNNKVVLSKGELLFLNQNATQEILPADEKDIAVNFIILPEFFDKAFRMIDKRSSLLREFLISCLRQNEYESKYLHFHVSDILPIQNLVENMIWTIMNDCWNKSSLIQTTMGLLLIELTNYMELVHLGENGFEHKLLIRIYRYIEENYKEGSLKELSEEMGYELYWLSKEIKKLTGKTYKELLLKKRMNQALFLLKTTQIPIREIANMIGYSNNSYFHRTFRLRYNMSPKEFREQNQ